MKRIAFRVGLAIAFMGFGWAIGKAQTNRPDFELVIDAPAGETNVVCKRGCELSAVYELSTNSDRYRFSCDTLLPSSPKRCTSALIGGFVKR